MIIITGCILRCYRLFSIPYTYDELSALHRTQFNSFHDLIANGIVPDGHPAGVQVFLFYWVKFFGMQEWIVKLPFIIMGILCIPLIYLIGKEWFNKSSALIAAALIACLQYPVMYSQIARPYISGLFLILLLTVILNRIIRKPAFLYFLWYAIVLALCAYTHYFCLLTAGCITLTGFFLIKKKDLWKYTVCLLVALTLFLPHLKIFLAQLSLGGLQWLNVPDRYFFTNYLFYIFNFSFYIIGIILLLVIAGFIDSGVGKKYFSRYSAISLALFLIPLITGYLYSKYRAPVLQYSVLIFSFPFLILFIASFTSFFPAFRNFQIGGLMVVLCASLIFERNYYTIFYNAETETFARQIIKWEKQFSTDKVAAVVQTNPDYLDFYKDKYGYDFKYKTFNEFAGQYQWRLWLANLKAGYLILCNPPVEWNQQYLSIAKEYYPYLADFYSGFTTEVYVLKKDSTKQLAWPKPFFSSGLSYSSDYWNMSGINETRDSTEKIFTISAESDSMPSVDKTIFEAPLEAICPGDQYNINVSVDVWVDSSTEDGRLLLDFLDDKRKVIQERQSSFSEPGIGYYGWAKVYLTARIYHTPYRSIKKVALVFTSDGAELKVKNLKLEATEGNPLMYSLIRR